MFCRFSRLSCRRGAVLIFVATCLSGCVRNEFDVQLKVTADGLERAVRIRPGRAEPKRQKQTEDEAKAESEKKEEFKRTIVTGDTPQDVGGAGRFVRYESPLGTAFVYIERFRGNDDLYTQHKARENAVDEFANHIVGWFESELGTDPDWPPVKEFLDKTFRHDLQNLSLHLTPRQHERDEKPQNGDAELLSLGVEAAQYLVERGYLSYEEMPAVMRSLEGFPHEATAGPLSRVSSILATKIRTAIPPEKFAFLSNGESLQRSWQKYFEQTEYYQREFAKLVTLEEKSLKEFRAAADVEQELQKRREELRSQVILELSMKAFVPWFQLRQFDSINLTLMTDNPPAWTDGTWDAAKKHVKWIRTVDVPDDSTGPRPLDPSAYCFAVWDQPNEEQQQKLFGNLAVRGKDLVEYCVWYQSLASDEQREWEEFLPTLKPDDASRRRLKHFRFESEAAKKNEAKSAARKGVRVIMSAFKMKTN